MSLSAHTLSLENWRNIPHREIALCPGMTILVGRNASGKTNSIEALQLLTTGTSFRHPRAAELIREGEAQARASLRLEGDGRLIVLEAQILPTKKTFLKNGKTCRPSSLRGILMSVLFTPDDLTLVKGSASGRRDELDSFGSQASASYARICSSYRRAVEQRNRLLKDDCVDDALLCAWDDSLATGAASLLFHRLNLFARLSETICSIYGQMVPDERLECRYESSLRGEVQDKDRSELAQLMADALSRGREEDLRRHMTLVGPHRDDVIFLIDGRDARTYGSQGQQRSIVLALKMAEVELSRQLAGQAPLLLLDDVMSELDEVRREAVLSFLLPEVQTVITTTNLGYFSREMLSLSSEVRFGDE